MVTTEEIGRVELFAALDSAQREQLSRAAADVRLAAGSTPRTTAASARCSPCSRAASSRSSTSTGSSASSASVTRATASARSPSRSAPSFPSASGDLNTPRRELPDGDVLTFACDGAGRLRPERGERWDRAERSLVHGLRERGWLDTFRAVNGYGKREASWTFARDKGGWRLDHVLVQGLEPVASAYAHDWRRAGLSDHSALVADLARRDGITPTDP